MARRHGQVDAVLRAVQGDRLRRARDLEIWLWTECVGGQFLEFDAALCGLLSFSFAACLQGYPSPPVLERICFYSNL